MQNLLLTAAPVCSSCRSFRKKYTLHS